MRKTLLHFQWDKNAVEGLACGGMMVLLSCAMNLFPNSTLAAVLFRDVLMIFALGFLLPLYSVLIRTSFLVAVCLLAGMAFSFFIFARISHRRCNR